MLEFALAENFDPNVVASSDGLVWLEALGARKYHTPMFGEVPMSVERLDRMVTGFKKNVRGQQIATNFDHGKDPAKGHAASGWFKDFAVKPSTEDPNQMSLWAAVSFTEEAKKEIKDGRWKYFSLEWDDYWQDNNGNMHEDVIVGGALTNRPVAKNLSALPINFSEAQWNELDEETRKYFAVWDTKYVNSLPDSSFLYVESAADEKTEGASSEKETPAEKRHLPYKNDKGEIDLAHLRNAIARIPQMKGVSDALKSKLQSKARSILAAQSKNMSEEVVQQIEAGTLVLVDEVKEWEHSEPGTGPAPLIGSPEQPDPGVGQPVPRITGDPSKEDPAIGGGWRREAMPPPDVTDEKGDTALTEEELKELRKALGVAEDADVPAIIAASKTMFSETAALRTAVGAASQEKEFSEKYPAVWAEHQKMREVNATNTARSFSESVSRVTKPEGDKQVATKFGLSALATDKLSEVHKLFAEGSVTLGDFEEVVRTIMQGGIVEFGETGSNQNADLVELDANTPGGLAAARKLFAEKVAEIQTADKLEYGVALTEASKKYPELAQAYRVTLPA